MPSRKRHAVLDDFVKYTETIQWQDSLLWMATLDSAVLRSRIDSLYASMEKKEDGKKKKRRRAAGGSNDESSSAFFQRESTSTTDWYFGNPSAVASGQTEFQRIWGSVPLEDNWRRSTKSADLSNVGQVPVADNAATGPTGSAPGVDKPVVSPAAAAATKLFSELPRTERAKNASLSKIEEAYFKLGDLCFNWPKKENAEDSYQKLLNRPPPPPPHFG